MKSTLGDEDCYNAVSGINVTQPKVKQARENDGSFQVSLVTADKDDIDNDDYDEDEEEDNDDDDDVLGEETNADIHKAEERSSTRKKRQRTDEKDNKASDNHREREKKADEFSENESTALGHIHQGVIAGDQESAPLIVANELLLQQQLQGNRVSTPVDDDTATFASTRATSGMGGGNIFGNSSTLREMQLAQFGAMGGIGGLQENPYLQQQLLMSGSNPFAGQGFAYGAQQSLSAHQTLSMASFIPDQQRRFPLTANSLQGNTPGNSGPEGSQTNALLAEQQAAALSFGFGARGGFLSDMGGYGGYPALQQMMYTQRSGDTEALAQARRQMMFGVAGMQGGGAGFRPSFLATGGGRGFNNMSAELRGLSGIGPQSPAVSLSLACDDEHLSEYQIMVRKQLEVFEAQPEDVESNTQGRKKQVSLGQVGIRCKHCASLPLRQRGRGAVYYPAKLHGVYQAAQNMASSHLCESCQCIDDLLKVALKNLRERRDTASGGKQYWADGARALGLYEADDGLRLNRESAQQNQMQNSNQGQTQTLP